jgi:integrase
MATKFETNQRSFHGGAVVIYQRPDHKEPKWQCRIRVQGATGYVIKSTQTEDEFEARRFAEDLYDELRLKVKSGGSLKSISFTKAFIEFQKFYKNSAPSLRRYLEVTRTLEKYACQYFGNTELDKIDSKAIAQFTDWRRTNGVKKVPANNTIRHELTYLKIFLHWCHSVGHIPKEVTIEKPSKSNNRRPHFSRNDWSRLTRFMRTWISRGEADGGKTRERLMLCQYMLVLANTGIRVGEARMLKWRDIESQERLLNDKKVKDIIFWVKGKTNSRDVVARSDAVSEYLSRIYEMRTKELGKAPPLEEYVFCRRNGDPIGNFKKGFESLLKAADVLNSSDGEKRTIYSLRHTYATFRLEEGVSVHILAKNMGTSTKMIDEHYGHTVNRTNAEELTKHRDKGGSLPEAQTKPWERIAVS